MLGEVFIWNVLILCKSLVIRKFKLCAMRLRAVEALGLQGRSTALFASRRHRILRSIVCWNVSNSKTSFDRCKNSKVLMSYFLRQTRKHFFISAIHRQECLLLPICSAWLHRLSICIHFWVSIGIWQSISAFAYRCSGQFSEMKLMWLDWDLIGQAVFQRSWSLMMSDTLLHGRSQSWICGLILPSISSSTS